MHDAPRRRGDIRRIQMVCDDPAVDDVVAACAELSHHCICHIGGDDKVVKAAYKARGYRLQVTFPFMVLDLNRRIRAESAFPCRRILTPEDAERVKRAARDVVMIAPGLLQPGDQDIRMYAPFDGDEAVGWVSSVRAISGVRYVSSAYVFEAYRRRGIGRALMSAMLDDDAALGARYSVLTSSVAGRSLYPSLGYEQIGLMKVFVAPKKK